MKIATLSLALLFASNSIGKSSAFASSRPTSVAFSNARTQLHSYQDDAPSDYDQSDLVSSTQDLVVDDDENDVIIREDLKRELLLLASITNRGEYASREERDIVVDLVTQLEALNPTAEPASNANGEWDLCISSTQFFRSSPFFQAIRVAAGDNNKAYAENFFDLHDRATAAGRVGRVRQIITQDTMISEVDLEVGVLPGLPIRFDGTVVTDAELSIRSADLWELKVRNTQVKGSNIPILNQLMDDLKVDLPVGDFYDQIGSSPVIPMKTFYVDDSLRITRDIDDNFYVFSRA
eukprot:CAMPEP_0198127398 /NCGR_PEP_ID=MMETSP1442-20131203/47040_1 /TAXON_ID= /ORGANISM="Craspedostauros australis, Strain CCMP3328" /LENGTH=292 /DNA_ID=CAMNT_0043787363 /DNA_START=10 /DNA_END=888 /DNA_ORIENTATION=-